MMKVIIKPLFHRGEQCIGFYFDIDHKILEALKKTGVAKFSMTHKCWYTPLNRENYNRLYFALKGLATIDNSALKKYLDAKKNDPSNSALVVSSPSLKPTSSISSFSSPEKNEPGNIHMANAHVLPKMKQKLKLKAYSPATIKTYINEMAQLLQMINNIPADELTPEHLKRYLVYCFEKLQLKENTLHSRINSLKFYYEQVLGRKKFFWEIPRPKKQLILPKVLSEAELGRLFKAINNIKHKAIVFTAYSAGLRVSEVINLKIKDVDSDRMTLFIRQSKGKMDRIVNLSPLLLDILRAYIKKSTPRPMVYLFEGEEAGKPYSARSAQQIFHDAKEKAGIRKEIGFHGLRHSFATHLLEKGVDIRYIKDILGHFDIRTTERYTHVSKRMLVNIGSPLDDLGAKGFLEGY
jgi:site-specific recombinase XerD